MAHLSRALRGAVLLLLPFQIGCLSHHFALQPAPPPEISSNVQGNLLTSTWLNDYHNKINTTKCVDGSSPTGTTPPGGMCQGGVSFTQEREALRNSYIEAIRSKITGNYQKFRSNLYGGNASFQLGSDLAVLGLTGAGTVVGDSGLQSILSVAASGVTGASSSYSKEVLNQQNTLAIIATMDANMATATTTIATCESQTVEQCPIEQAIGDLQSLYLDGGVVSALVSIQGTAQNTKNEELKKTQTIREAVH